MKILLFEYISGGGLNRESIPQSLLREGDSMLRALFDDLRQIPGIHLSVMRDARFDARFAMKAQAEVIWVEPHDDFDDRWRYSIQRVDAVWPIAPESGRVLERLCAEVREARKILLNSPAEAVALTASKLQTLTCLEAARIGVMPSLRLVDFRDQFSGPWVIKPDDGAGCEGIRLVRELKELDLLQVQESARTMLIQPYVEGCAMSISALFRNGEALLLSCNRQLIVQRDAGFSLAACTVNVRLADFGIFVELVNAIARAIPNLFGYVGVDLIYAEGKVKVLEINPRLTTSYTGLSLALHRNVAAMVLDLLVSDAPLREAFEYSGTSVQVELDERFGSLSGLTHNESPFLPTGHA